MKILFIAPYMTNNNVPVLSQCKAGFGYMVYDIAASVAKKITVDGLLYNYRYEDFKSDNIIFKGCSWFKFLKNIFNCSSPILPLKLYCRYHMQLRTFVRLCYGWLLSGYFKSVIKNGNYNVVHIHGCGFINEYFIEICKCLNIPFIVTLHGLNSFSDSVKLEQAGKMYEKDFLRETLEKEYIMTVIASGIKRTILNYYNVDKADNIHIINNAFTFTEQNIGKLKIKEIYGIPSTAKIILYIGNISSNKNQEQMVKAFCLLPNEWKEKVYVLFLGRNNEPGYSIDELIKSTGYEEHLIQCGNIDKSEIGVYYEQADAVALLSIAEGFGLSLIEGMHFGLPCMTFKDLDAFNDIYTNIAVTEIPDRNDMTVSSCIVELLSNKWDSEAIKDYSKRFTVDFMADNYIDVYNKSINE